MAYLTQLELQARVGGYDALVQLTDDDQDEVVDPEVIALVLTGLDSELDFYFRAGRYSPVPIGSTLFLGAKNYALDVANYRLKTRGDREASPEDRTRYEDAVSFFRLIAKRELILEAVSTSSVAGALVSEAPVFTVEEMAKAF